MRPDRRSRGYTLVEVLVAFLILAMALTVLLRIFSSGLRNVGIASDYAAATLIAESRLAATGIGEPLVPGETGGLDAQRFSWTRTVSDYTPHADYRSTARDFAAYYVTVTVSWPNGDRERRVDIATIKFVDKKGQVL